MNYASVKEYDIANGPGIRLTLFVSGCTHHCRECFNPETWSFSYGKPFTEETADHLIALLKEDAYEGLTLLGGEPMEPVNQAGLLPFLKRVRAECPDRTIWCFTGYLFDRDLLGETMKDVAETRELLGLIDVLVDGEFKIEEKDVTLLYKGSRNQRTIDVPRSLEKGEIVFWEPVGITISPKTHL